MGHLFSYSPSACIISLFPVQPSSLFCLFRAELHFRICHFSLVRFGFSTSLLHSCMFTNVEATTMRNGRCMLSKVLQSFFMVINFDGYLDSVLYIYMLLLTLLLFCLNFFPSSFQCSMFMLLNRSFQKYGVRKLCFNVFTSPGKEYLNFLSLHCMFIFTPSLYSTLMIK